MVIFRTAPEVTRTATGGLVTPEQRSLRARIASHTRWANEIDPSAATAPARKAALERFERQVDPDGVLDPEERSRRAEHAKKVHFLSMALKSAQARRRSA